MVENNDFLTNLIGDARRGNTEALSELSGIALGGNPTAQVAIREIDKDGFKPQSKPHKGNAVWPKDVEEGKRGPRLGDVALHINL